MKTKTYTISWIAIIYKDDRYKYIDDTIKLDSQKDLSINEIDEIARDIIKVNILDKYDTDRIFKLYITNVD